MAVRTRTKNQKVALLGEPPSDKQVLLVKNLFPGGLSLRPDEPNKALDLRPRESALVDKSWRTNADFLKFLSNGLLSAKWVSDDVEVDEYPNLDKAPEELKIENTYERAVALTIAQSEDSVSLALSNITVNKPDTTEIDIQYMRVKLSKVYKLAIWCEEQLDNRPKVIAKLKQSLRTIQDL